MMLLGKHRLKCLSSWTRNLAASSLMGLRVFLSCIVNYLSCSFTQLVVSLELWKV